MSFPTMHISPFNLLFFIIIAGVAIGKIRIHRISVGIAGILFSAILVGSLTNLLITEAHADIIESIQSTMKFYSKLGTSLFVSVIGLQTGFSIKSNSKGSLISFVIGSLMSISGSLIMLLILTFDPTISHSTLLGVLCGALTNTPGLSSVCEMIGINSEEAVRGYSCSYLFGVIFTVIFAQLFTRKTNDDGGKKTKNTANASKRCTELMLISITALPGNILGNLYIPFLHISIGNTAGILLVGLIVGYIVQRRVVTIQSYYHILNAYKNLGLALFFAGTGFTTGIQPASLNVKTIIYGALITITAILCGLFLCRITSSKHSLNNGFIVAGGMTSSPAYGAISSRASESSINCFSFAYFGSLISLIIALQIVGL